MAKGLRKLDTEVKKDSELRRSFRERISGGSKSEILYSLAPWNRLTSSSILFSTVG
jgi:hypothetical protein